MPESVLYLYALGASLSFATASIVFTRYCHLLSPLWMNMLKCVVSVLAFGVVKFFHGHWETFIPTNSTETTALLALCFSGAVGLVVGDQFLLHAYTRIGAARTLMIFSFEPFFMAVLGYFFLHQSVEPHQLIAIFFLMACILTMSYEHFKQSGKWEIKGLLFGLAAVSLDATGLFLSRLGFELNPKITIVDGNLIRSTCAFLSFFCIGWFMRLHFFRSFGKLRWKEKMGSSLAAFLATFIGLWLWLTAISEGHLATITAIAGTGPVFATVLESFWHRRWPSRYLLIALSFFVVGFFILIGI